jgi:hypothetical protein
VEGVRGGADARFRLARRCEVAWKHVFLRIAIEPGDAKSGTCAITLSRVFGQDWARSQCKPGRVAGGEGLLTWHETNWRTGGAELGPGVGLRCKLKKFRPPNTS